MNREHVSEAELVGRLGQRPALEETNEGTKYTKLNIATSERYTDRAGQIHERTEWTRAVAWGALAEGLVGRFDTGDSIALKGAMRVNSWEKDGAKNRTIELHAESVEPNPDKTVSRNEARLVGVVRSIENKDLASGTPMTVLSVGTTTKQNGKDREDWHSVTLWDKTAQAGAKEIGVGDTVAINGVVRHRTVPGPENVERRLSAIDCRQFQVLERARDKSKDVSRENDPGRAAPGAVADKPRTRQRSRSKNVERDM
jgi:single-strand DNA-binding protein